MKIVKLFWGLRAIIYKIAFKKIGLLTYIGKPIILQGIKNVQIGNKVRIYPGMRMETHGTGGAIQIEDNVSIGQNLHIIAGGETLIIGKDTTISGNVFISNMDHDYRKIGLHVLEQELIIKRTKIGSNCFIGYGAVIQAGTILGSQCIIGANSVVRGMFPDNCVIAGVPAKIIKKYNADTNIWERFKEEE